MKKICARFLLSLMLMLSSGLWLLTIAQSVSVPVGFVRDYNVTKEELKVARDSVVLLGADVVMWRDSAAIYKVRYVQELKWKKRWRVVALVFVVREGVKVWLRRIGSSFVI